MKKIVTLLALSTVMVSCTPAPESAYFNRGEPESLLDVTSEVVNIRLTSQASVQKVISVVNKEQPTRAKVACKETDSLCKQVKGVMKQFKVPVEYHTAKTGGTVSIVYERIMARNCQNRFIDNTANDHNNNMNNLNYPTLGCSVAINTVQMVTDKHQFTNPTLMDSADSKKPLQAITNYDTVTKTDTTFSPMVEGGGSGSSGGR